MLYGKQTIEKHKEKCLKLPSNLGSPCIGYEQFIEHLPKLNVLVCLSVVMNEQ